MLFGKQGRTGDRRMFRVEIGDNYDIDIIRMNQGLPIRKSLGVVSLGKSSDRFRGMACNANERSARFCIDNFRTNLGRIPRSYDSNPN